MGPGIRKSERKRAAEGPPFPHSLKLALAEPAYSASDELVRGGASFAMDAFWSGSS